VKALPQPLLGPQRVLRVERGVENAALDKLGLRDPATGLARLPERAVQTVLAQVKAAPRSSDPDITGLEQLAPSGYSGGTRLENVLR
jgi:hypothetical protein